LNCKKKLSWYEVLPVVSFVCLRRKCLGCKYVFSWNYILIECVVGFLYSFLGYLFLLDIISVAELFFEIFLTTILVVIFLFDGLYGIVLPSIIGMGVLVGLVGNYFNHSLTVLNQLAACLVGGGFFLIQFVFSKGKWVGFGDVYIGCMMGIWLGSKKLLVALFLAYFIGGVIAFLLLFFKKKQVGNEIPMGIFLTIGTFLSMCFGGNFINYLLSW
jgi:prepilin signal peptidase PulO-like enzyme (type II secretory pathway)